MVLGEASACTCCFYVCVSVEKVGKSFCKREKVSILKSLFCKVSVGHPLVENSSACNGVKGHSSGRRVLEIRGTRPAGRFPRYSVNPTFTCYSVFHQKLFKAFEKALTSCSSKQNLLRPFIYIFFQPQTSVTKG